MSRGRKKWMSREGHEKASAKTRRGWKTKHAEGTAIRGDSEVELVPAFKHGDYIGTFRWLDRAGDVTQAIVKRGPRANQIQIGKTVCGWDYLTERIRKRLSRPRKAPRLETQQP